MYDKAASIICVESTIAKTQDFKVFRPPHKDPHGKLDCKPLRKGVADLHRRAEIFDGVAKPVIQGKRRSRALSADGIS